MMSGPMSALDDESDAACCSCLVLALLLLGAVAPN